MQPVPGSLRGHQRLGLVALLGLLALMILGGTVRVTDSGLACPDWPLCHGQLLPDDTWDHHVWLEWTHRLVASVMGFVLLAYAWSCWRHFRQRRWVVVPAMAMLAVLAVQVVLGGLTVTEDLDAEIVMAHMAGAMMVVLLFSTSWLASFAREGPRQAVRPLPARARPVAALVVVTGMGIGAMLVLGAYVSGTHAGFACQGWPVCNDALLPDGRLPQIQTAHRYLGIVAAGLGLLTLGSAWRVRREAAWLTALVSLMALLYLASVLLGGAAVWSTMQDWARISHLTAAALLWGTTVVTVLLTLYRAGWAPDIGARRPWRRTGVLAAPAERAGVRD